MLISQSSRRYQERRGVIPTSRLPTARVALRFNLVNSFPLSPPLPVPELMQPLTGAPNPDSPLATVWPFGVP